MNEEVARPHVYRNRNLIYMNRMEKKYNLFWALDCFGQVEDEENYAES